jgi:hypothetical protein
MEQEIRLREVEIKKLRKEKEEREASLTAHTIRPHQIMAIEELENEISRKEKQLSALKGQFKSTL